MNLKDYSLHEHLKHTMYSLYNNDSPRIDTNVGTIFKEDYKYAKQELGTFHLCYIREVGSNITIDYDNAKYSYEKSYGSEKLITPNMVYHKNLLKNIILTKVNYLYRMTKNAKEIQITNLNNKNIKEVLQVDSSYKINKIFCDYFNYTEKYTRSSKKLVLSELRTNYVAIQMKKNVSSDTGRVIITSLKNGLERMNFEFQGEPCLLRLLNKSFIFNALISTALADILDDVYEAINVLIEKIKLTKVSEEKIYKIVEYYKNYGS